MQLKCKINSRYQGTLKLNFSLWANWTRPDLQFPVNFLTQPNPTQPDPLIGSRVVQLCATQLHRTKTKAALCSLARLHSRAAKLKKMRIGRHERYFVSLRNTWFTGKCEKLHSLAWKRRYDLTNYRIEPYQTARRTAEHIGPHRTTSDLN